MLACGVDACFDSLQVEEQLAAAPLVSAPQIIISDSTHLDDLVQKLPGSVALIDKSKRVQELIFGINQGIDFAQPIRRELPVCSLHEFADLGSTVSIRCGGPHDTSPCRTASVILCTKNTVARLLIVEPPPHD